MGINGNISTMSLAEVFQWLATGRKTGTLQIQGKHGINKDVYFEDGCIKSASSNDPDELIGQFLICTRRISEQQLHDALEAQKHDHVMLGKILLNKGFLNKDELLSLLRTISEEVIYDLFLWKEGTFNFQDGQLPDREMPSLNMDITHIVLEGATREDEWIRIKQIFPDDGVVVRPNVERIARILPLDPSRAKLLRIINGIRNLHDLSRIYKATRYALYKAMLSLHEDGLIEVGDYRMQLIQPEVAPQKNPLKEMIHSVEAMMNSGKLEDAERGIGKLEKMASHDPDVIKLRTAIQDKRLETTAKQMINPDAVPILKMPVEKLTAMDMNPEQGFLVSRINGVWDVKSIVKISPFGELTCLRILKQFMDDGVITLQ